MTELSIVYRFGSYQLNPPQKLLFCGDKVISLSQKAFESLLLLVGNAWEIVFKEDFSSQMRTDSVIKDEVLAVNISGLIKSDDRKFTEIFSCRGYRFIVKVKHENLSYLPNEEFPYLIFYPRLADFYFKKLAKSKRFLDLFSSNLDDIRKVSGSDPILQKA